MSDDNIASHINHLGRVLAILINVIAYVDTRVAKSIGGLTLLLPRQQQRHREQFTKPVTPQEVVGELNHLNHLVKHRSPQRTTCPPFIAGIRR